MLPKVQVKPKGPPFGFFFGTMRLFSKIFEIYQRVPPWIFLKFSVCRKRWMSLNGLFLSFSALCDLKNTFFRKKIKNFFLKNFFFQIFPIVVAWIFLSLRYGADLGRSRLVFSSDYNPHTDRSTFYNSAQSTWGQVRPRQTLLQRVPPFIFYFFKETYKTGRAQRVPPLDFFRNCATFFRKFFNVPKGSPLWVFLIFCNGMFVNKSRRVPPFTFFGTMRLLLKEKFFSKISIFFQKKCFTLFEP